MDRLNIGSRRERGADCLRAALAFGSDPRHACCHGYGIQRYKFAVSESNMNWWAKTTCSLNAEAAETQRLAEKTKERREKRED